LNTHNRAGAPAVLELPAEDAARARQPVLVTGAGGFVGEQVCAELTRRSWRVRALVRDRADAALRLDPRVEICPGDIRDGAGVRSALDGCGSVVHLAAIAIERGPQTYEAINTGGTDTLLAAALDAGARRFVYMSQNGADERSPSRFLRSKGAAQRLVRDSTLAWTTLRPSVIFGPRDEFVNVLARLARLTPLFMPLPDWGRARFQPVAVADVASAVAVCLEQESSVHRTYTIGGPAPLTLKQITERVLLAMRARRAIVGVPRGALRPLIAVMQRVLPNPPVTTELLDLLGQDNVTPDNAIHELGLTPIPFAPEELDYLRELTLSAALRAFFR
jgi:uncharacterized protein YbjT (DUF2867 family)